MTIRSTPTRIAETIERLSTDEDVWIATASESGVPHLVPLSLAWHAGHVLVATPADTPTVRNVRETSRARASLDSTADVVIISARASCTAFEDTDKATRAAFVSAAGWNPETLEGTWSLITLVPDLIHVWNSVAEIEGRTIMRHGAWVES
ncbi:MAG: pyridoxamine 5'-phosphate oxidase family protein [Actinomycetia bacterium]|nr:pyridoxamine 5'-phosphate oxidase family protein [Actinomycetes bacterium]